MRRLVEVVQELSMARDLPAIMKIVRSAARELVMADGATFVLRDGGFCYYADEDAVSALWKGQRFPVETCISGWVMAHRQPAVIEDIFEDSRIPIAAYEPTFVRSLVMVPIRSADPIGAVGAYWAENHLASPQEGQVLQALADTTAVAMENVGLYHGLEKRVAERTAELEAANGELEAFTRGVSHDLKTPLQNLVAFSGLLEESSSTALGDEARQHLATIQRTASHALDLVDGLLELSRANGRPLQPASVHLSEMAAEIASELRASSPDRAVEFVIPDDVTGRGDPVLVRLVLENLLRNAWKFTVRRPTARIELGFRDGSDGEAVYFVRDDGVGFEPSVATSVFEPFRRLHSSRDFPGSGIGLATVRSIIERHGGRVWAEAAPGRGATFFFTLPNEGWDQSASSSPLGS